MQNRNTMCAECHSTALQKYYDPLTTRFCQIGCRRAHGGRPAVGEPAARWAFQRGPDPAGRRLRRIRGVPAPQRRSAGGRGNLGEFMRRRGDAAAATQEFCAGLRLEPTSAPLSVDLADLCRSEGQEVGAEQILRQATSLTPNPAAAHHAAGPTLIRRKRYAEDTAAPPHWPPVRRAMPTSTRSPYNRRPTAIW